MLAEWRVVEQHSILGSLIIHLGRGLTGLVAVIPLHYPVMIVFIPPILLPAGQLSAS